LSTRFKPDNRVKRGAFPHIRVPSSRQDHSGPPSGLPKNFYNKDYLARLDEVELDALSFLPSVSIAFSPRV
ncbi:hypothetical protein CPB83DRAFT_738381, partial [Crepidotus variabilis]